MTPDITYVASSFDENDPPWEFPHVLWVLPHNCKTYGESLEAPRRKYVLADPADPRDALLSRDLDTFLKGRELIDSPSYIFDEPSKIAWWKLRSDMSVGAAIKAVRLGDHYRAKAVAIQRAADLAADQASERFKAERRRAEAAEAKLAALARRDDVTKRLVEALSFYADFHENPNDGPWGVSSEDFGKTARAALAFVREQLK